MSTSTSNGGSGGMWHGVTGAIKGYCQSKRLAHSASSAALDQPPHPNPAGYATQQSDAGSALSFTIGGKRYRLDKNSLPSRRRRSASTASRQSGGQQQSVVSQMPMPDKHELDRQFNNLVVELDLSVDNQQLLLQQPAEKKWHMIQERSHALDTSSGSVSQFVRELETMAADASTIDNARLEQLRCSLKHHSHSFVQQFLAADGCVELTALLRLCTGRPALGDAAAIVLGCFKALLNSSQGRRVVMKSSGAMQAVAEATAIEHTKCKIAALEILSGVCLFADGSSRVLEAFTRASPQLGERTRFQRLLQDLWRPYDNRKECVRVKTAIMSLVNALLKSGIAHDSAEFRVHLRHELLMLGITETIEQARLADNHILDDHLDLFDMMRQEDEQELLQSWDIELPRYDARDPLEMTRLLVQRLTDTQAQPHLVSLIQHLLLIPGDTKHMELWRLLDLIVQQLSLQANVGVVADALEPVQQLDMDEVLNRLHTQSEYERLEKSHHQLQAELDESQKRCTRLELQVTKLRAHKHADCNSIETSSDSTPPCDPEMSPSEPGDDLEINVKLNGEFLSSLSPGSSSQQSSTNCLPAVKPPAAVPPPPPPPSDWRTLNLHNGDADKRVPKPGANLRSVQWDKLGARAVKHTIWEDIDDEKFYEMLDLRELDQNFAIMNRQADTCDDASMLGSTLQRRSVALKDNCMSLIDTRRAQNCTILLSRLKLSNREIRRAVLSMDEEAVLPKDMVEQLLKYVPTGEDLELINEALHGGTAESCLAQADRFLLDMSKIPRYEQRLHCLFVIKNFRERVSECRPQMQSIERASRAVSTSKRLRKLLALILAIGNYMNYGKRNANAYGFGIGSVSVLPDVKCSTRPDQSLMHYIARFIDAKQPDILRMKRELNAVFEACRVNQQELTAELEAIRCELDKVQLELALHRKGAKKADWPHTADADDRFMQVVEEFLKDANMQHIELQQSHKSMTEAFHACARLFNLRPAETSPESLFGHVSRLITQLTDALHQLWHEREEEEKMKRRTLARSFFAKRSSIAATADGPSSMIRSRTNQDFDSLISALQTGEFFTEDLSRLRKSFRTGRTQQRVPAQLLNNNNNNNNKSNNNNNNNNNISNNNNNNNISNNNNNNVHSIQIGDQPTPPVRHQQQLQQPARLLKARPRKSQSTHNIIVQSRDR